MFNAIVISKEKEQSTTLTSIDKSMLNDGDVTINVAYSTLNYKDALAICQKPGVVREWPMIPGIDLAGTVTESSSNLFEIGDKVLVNGYGIGEVHSGGLAQQARVKSEWLVPLPSGISLKQSMAIGTAGYTAMLSVLALEKQDVDPSSGEVLVTGAAGGVGSVAISLLSYRCCGVEHIGKRNSANSIWRCGHCVRISSGNGLTYQRGTIHFEGHKINWYR